MKCLRCGYCCIALWVIIRKDDQLWSKPSNLWCPHLSIDDQGIASCAVHNEPWYSDTPCAQYTQIETSPDCLCRMGHYQRDSGTDGRDLHVDSSEQLVWLSPVPEEEELLENVS